MPKVIAIADQHGYLPEIEECDVLLISGDICPDYLRQYARGGSDEGSKCHKPRIHKGEPEQANWLHGEFRGWLDSIPAKHIVAVAGNHDFVFQKPSLIDHSWLPWTYLKDELIEVEGLRIYGVPWVINLPFWAFNKTEHELEEHYVKIPDDLDVLLTHGPPYGYGDKVKYMRPDEVVPHVGSKSLNDAIYRAKPRMVVCGHIHEAYGWYRHRDAKGTEVYNVSVVDETYALVNPPVELPL